MTALFLFAEKDVVFVASDTKRNATLSWQPTVARKTYIWTERALIAQTGFGEGLQRLIGEMAAVQHRDMDLSRPGGALKAFDMLRAYRLAHERHYVGGKFPGQIAGTLLLAEPEHLTRPASIYALDWATGAATPMATPTYADGTAPAAFQLIADAQYRAHRPTGSGPIDLAAWGIACIATARKDPLADNAVDFPADLTIIRRDAGNLITLSQRVDDMTSKTHPLFLIP